MLPSLERAVNVLDGVKSKNGTIKTLIHQVNRFYVNQKEKEYKKLMLMSSFSQISTNHIEIKRDSTVDNEFEKAYPVPHLRILFMLNKV